MPDLAALIEVMEEARSLAAPDEIVEEIDGYLASLRAGTLPSYMAGLFLPTGPLQDLSVMDGWGDEFCALADRYDAAMAAPSFLASMKACACFTDPNAQRDEVRALGMDSRFGEVSILRCPVCAQLWLRYLYEDEAISRSGRWYVGPIDSVPPAEDARAVLEGMEGYFYGGSYYLGEIGWTSGPVA